jgi:hypothetical protein
MTDTPPIEIAGHRWVLGRMKDRDALTVECYLLRLLGPAIGRACSELLGHLANEIVKIVREATGEGESFDLRGLLDLADIETTDPRVERAWSALLDELPVVLDALLVDALPLATDRIEPEELRTVLELLIFGVVLHVGDDGKPRAVKDWNALTKLSRRAPGVKWALAKASILHHYGRELVAWIAARIVDAARAAGEA